MPKNCSYGICKSTTANSSARLFRFPTHHDPDRRKLGLAYGLCDVNVRRLMVPAGSRRQKSSRADIMSVVCTVHFASGSDTTVLKCSGLDFTSNDAMECLAF